MPAPAEGRDNAAEAARSSSPSSASTASLGSAGAAGAGPPAQAEASHSRVKNAPNAAAAEDGSEAEGRSPPRGDEVVPRRDLVVGAGSLGDLVAVQAGEAGGAQNLPNAARDSAPDDNQENELRNNIGRPGVARGSSWIKNGVRFVHCRRTGPPSFDRSGHRIVRSRQPQPHQVAAAPRDGVLVSNVASQHVNQRRQAEEEAAAAQALGGVAGGECGAGEDAALASGLSSGEVLGISPDNIDELDGTTSPRDGSGEDGPFNSASATILEATSTDVNLLEGRGVSNGANGGDVSIDGDSFNADGSEGAISTDANLLEGNDSNGTTDVFDADAPIFRSVAKMKDVCGDEMEALNELNRQYSQAMDALLRAKTRSQKSLAEDAGEDLLPQIVATQRRLVEKVANYEGQTDPSLYRNDLIDLKHRYSKRVFTQVLSHWPAKKAPSAAQKKRPSNATSSGSQRSTRQRTQRVQSASPQPNSRRTSNGNTSSANNAAQATGPRRSKRKHGNEDAAIDSRKENSRAVKRPPAAKTSNQKRTSEKANSPVVKPAPKKSRRRTRKSSSISYKESNSDDEGSSGAESDREDASTEKGAAKKRAVADAEYDKLKRELASTCKRHQKDGKWEGEPSRKVPDGLRKKCPPELKKSILNALLEKHNLNDMSELWKETLWDKAATIARDGKKVNGDGAGDVSFTYENTKSAETCAKRCTDDGTAELYDKFVGGKDDALRFAEEAKKSEAKHAEFKEAVERVWVEELKGKRSEMEDSAAEQSKVAEEKANLEVRVLVAMEAVQPTREARKEVLDAMKHANTRIADADAMCRMSAKNMITVCEKSLRNNPIFAVLHDDAQENGVRTVKSEICHQQVSVRVIVKMKRAGLVHIHDMKDENGREYKAIFVAAPEWLILHYCQGAAKKVNGGPSNTQNRAPVETGGHLQVDILNGGLAINTNALVGERGHLDDETKRIFQVLSVTTRRKGTIDKYEVSMPKTDKTLQLHQLVLGTGYFYGMNSHLECHTREGGILAGVVGDGETVEEQFRCHVKCPRIDSLIEQGLVPDPSMRCDGDHLFGRSTVYMNGIWWVQPVSHRENGTRSWVRKRWGEWLIPLCIGEYTDGNTTPASSEKRI